jgi:hypothetical protein
LSLRDTAEDLSATGLRFDIANPHLQMAFPNFAIPDERGIQGDSDHRRRRFRPDRGAFSQRFAGPEGTAAQRLRVGSGVDRKQLLQHGSGHWIGHQGRKMRPKPVQFRCRSAV